MDIILLEMKVLFNLKSKTMKNLSIYLLSFLFIVLLAEANYNKAIKASKKCYGSDISIEITMRKYGFSADAMDTTEPSTLKKI